MRAVRAVNRTLLRAAALLVPRDGRAEWQREWRAELWHVEGAASARTSSTIRFCLGAFADGLCLRRVSAATRIPFATTRGSALACLCSLAFLIAVSAGTGMLLPGVRAQVRPGRYQAPRGLILIQSALHGDESSPTVSTEQFLRWRMQPRLFADASFYEMRQQRLGRGPGQRTIVYASPDLLTLLRISMEYSVANNSGLPRLILSQRLWREAFDASPQVLGRAIYLGSEQVVIAGVAAADAWHLPGRADAWLLEPNTNRMPAGNGFVVARLSPLAPRQHFGREGHTYAHRVDEVSEDLSFTQVSERTQGPWAVLAFGILLGILALPATTPLSLGEYRMPPARPSWRTRLRRWTFLAAKIILLMALIACVSIDLAYASSEFAWYASEYILLAVTFLLCLFGLRWAIHDQRRRCPMCLGRLTHPARVGEPSRNFLSWNGTELMCVGGHGLLHVPEMSTSWFSTQRWLHLDPSWEVLFGQSGSLPHHIGDA